MPGVKRSYQGDQTVDLEDEENVHPSRKRKLELSESQKELSEIFRELRDDIPEVRSQATVKLLKTLTAESDDHKARLDYALTRLIKGVCSGAGAARPGFAVALAEVLRLAGKGESNLAITDLVDKIVALTGIESKQSGEEQRNYLLGRRFSFQAVLQSGLLTNSSESDVGYVFDAISDLALEKEWLRSECGAMLYEYLKSSTTQDHQVLTLINALAGKSLLKSTEGVALWLTARKHFKHVKLPKGHWHHNNPLSSQDRSTLKTILLRNAIEVDEEKEQPATQGGGKKKKKTPGMRQTMPNFAWSVILSHLYEKDDGKTLPQFWEDCVAKPMFSSTSSAERKSLGLQIFTKALSSAPADQLSDIVHANIVRCIVDQRAKADRYLFDAAKLPLNQMVTRGQNEPAAAAEIAAKLLEVTPANVDKTTRSTIEALLAAADPDGLVHVVKVINDVSCSQGSSASGDEAEKKRRALADALLTIVRTRRSDPAQFFQDEGSNVAQWLKTLLRNLTNLAFEATSINPPISEVSRNMFRERLQSILGHLVDLPLHQATIAPMVVIDRLHSIRKNLATDMDSLAVMAVKDARKALKQAEARAVESEDDANGKKSASRAFQLLLALSMLSVYKQDPDSVGILENAVACYQSFEKGVQVEETSPSDILVELLLGFISQQSALLRKLAGQVFTAFAPNVTVEGLQSMVEILTQKESLAGQQELLQNGDDDDVDMEDGDDSELEDVDLSNLQLLSTDQADAGAASDDDDDASIASSSSSEESDTLEGSDSAENEDEEAAFNRKLAGILGTAAADSDDDGSDMDDDQMMEKEHLLTEIFKQKTTSTSKKQENKDAKENIIHFKNRVLDLLLIFVKTQYSNPLALNLVDPLVTLTRTTGNQPTARKACEVLEAWFDASKKHKALPHLDGDDSDDDDEDEDASEKVVAILSAVHAEMRRGGSKTHATACSRASLFLTKILLAMNEDHYDRVGQMYVSLQKEWRANKQSKIHGSILSDWNNWVMQR